MKMGVITDTGYKETTLSEHLNEILVEAGYEAIDETRLALIEREFITMMESK